jgi:hypothetical protein
MWGWFLAKLGLTIIALIYFSSHQNFCGHWQPQGHNKQEPTTLTLPYGSNKHHCMG